MTFFVVFVNDPATTEIDTNCITLARHDALPSCELAAGIEASEAKLVNADVQRAARLAGPGVQHGAKVVTLDIAQPLDRAIAPITAGGSAEKIGRAHV